LRCARSAAAFIFSWISARFCAIDIGAVVSD
jgi:hypothetical protein